MLRGHFAVDVLEALRGRRDLPARWQPPALCAAAALWIAGCGDNIPDPEGGPPLVPARALIVNAHFDDDIILMAPALQDALAAGSVTTLYVFSGDLRYGDGRARHSFGAALVAYGGVLGSSDWDCGNLSVAGAPVQHCRLRDRPISLISLDIPDGGIDGEAAWSPLHVFEGNPPSIGIRGEIGGTATPETITATLAALIEATAPEQIDALDLAATHGRDHSSHMFASSYAFWAAARLGYPGPIRWHRGYNVDVEPRTFDGDAYAAALKMLGYFDACYFGSAPCGTPSSHLDQSHECWMQRQYSFTRSPVEASAPLALQAAPALCVTPTPAGITVANCAAADAVELDARGHLHLAGLDGVCLASPLDPTAPVVLEPCDTVSEQYWASDSEGHLWNGRRPEGAPGMDYDHVRCLNAEPQPGAAVTAPVCGSRLSPRWSFGSGVARELAASEASDDAAPALPDPCLVVP
jgi:hypothetical protein